MHCSRTYGHLLLLLCFCVNRFASESEQNNSSDKSNSLNINDTLADGLAAGSAIFGECKDGKGTCLRTELQSYMDQVVETLKDYDLREVIRFVKNNNSYSDLDESNEIESENVVQRKFLSPLEKLERNFSKFIFTHDIQITLPESLFESNVLEIAPRAAKDKDKGVIAQFKIFSKDAAKGKPRIFHKIKKIGEKLKNAALAIILLLALVKILTSFLLPLIVGVAKAKQMLVKTLLFLFPFLSVVFKLCPYTPFGTKFHHHHHHISHAHHIPHTPSFVHHDLKHPDHHGHHEVITGPDYISEGPAFTGELISHRKDPASILHKGVPHKVGQGQHPLHRHRKPPSFNKPLTPAEIDALVNEAERDALLKARLQQERIKVQAENKRLQEQIRLQLLRQDKLKMQVAALNGNKITDTLVPPSASEAPLSITGSENKLISSHPLSSSALESPFEVNNYENKLSSPQTEATIVQNAIQKAAAITFDSFYSPILEKIDYILIGLGFNEEPCKERLICSMYKNPPKWSPYSNFVSAELSRDADELKKPTHANAAVIRFYTYVQAARDGQDQKDCLKLYPACSTNTEL